MSPQAQGLYRLLLESHKPLSAEHLAARLGIVPNSIYRLISLLIEAGLVEKTEGYPRLFRAKSTDEALSLFLLNQSSWFSSHFPVTNADSSAISFSFIQSRDELMRLSTEEVNKASQFVDLLRSGAEFPADLLLAMVNAQKRGVTTRMLIQDYSSENYELVRNWKTNGIQVRKTPLKQVRLMVYDAKTVYFMSYRHSESERDLGFKINYQPLAIIISRQFEQWWKTAKEV